MKGFRIQYVVIEVVILASSLHAFLKGKLIEFFDVIIVGFSPTMIILGLYEMEHGHYLFTFLKARVENAIDFSV